MALFVSYRIQLDKENVGYGRQIVLADLLTWQEDRINHFLCRQEVVMKSASEVCRLAHVDRDRLNEAIARGDYPCAPETRPGARRMFGEADFIALAAYGALTARGVPPRLAGGVACSVLTAVENSPAANHLAIIWGEDGRADGVTPDIDYALGGMKVPSRAEFEAGGQDALKRAYFPIASVEILNVAAFRGKFRVALARKEDENSLVLEDDQTDVAVAAFRQGLLGAEGGDS
jgi:hypothetical protein